MPRYVPLINTVLRAPRPHPAIPSSSHLLRSPVPQRAAAQLSKFIPSILPRPSPLSLLPSSLLGPSAFSPTHFSLLTHSPLRSNPLLHPHPHALQLRFKARGTEYQPSQRVRKRRHGFLSRMRTVGGRRILVRRREKGRRYLSH